MAVLACCEVIFFVTIYQRFLVLFIYIHHYKKLL